MKPRRDAMSKAIFVLLYILASVSSTLAASWPTAHGGPTNTGFARVDTRPATNRSFDEKTPDDFKDDSKSCRSKSGIGQNL